MLKYAAKTRKVPQEEILNAFSMIEKSKLDPSGFLETLGGTKSPGRTWMLIFTAQVMIKLICNKVVVVIDIHYLVCSHFVSFVCQYDDRQKKLDRGTYFPITAVQRFDAAVSFLTIYLSLFALVWITFDALWFDLV